LLHFIIYYVGVWFVFESALLITVTIALAQCQGAVLIAFYWTHLRYRISSPISQNRRGIKDSTSLHASRIANNKHECAKIRALAANVIRSLSGFCWILIIALLWETVELAIFEPDLHRNKKIQSLTKITILCQNVS
jgi:hypothetical protein